MLLTFKTTLSLNKKQIEILEHISDSSRLLYNMMLSQKNKFYEKNQKHLSYYIQQKELKNIKDDYLTFDTKKEILRTLENNYKSFFTLIKNKNITVQSPRYRDKDYFFTLSYVQDFIIEDKNIIISLPKRKRLILKLNYNEPISNCSCKRSKTNESEIKQLKIFKKNNKFYASIVYEKKELKNEDNKVPIVIDLGKKNLVSYYDPTENKGVIFSSNLLSKNQKYYDKRTDELKSIRDKKKKFSIKWKKANDKIKKLNSKKKTQTNLTLQKLSKDLSNLNTNIVIGELTNLKQNTLTKTNKLNRQMQNNWNLATFIRLLEYKTQLKGNKVIKVNEAWTSKTCCKCGSINHDLTLANREYSCECGNSIDRDINGAINIYKQYTGDYSTPIDFDTLSISERFSWCRIRKMNEK